ncbi:hypothetical protein G6011_02158 [Alternaria panax]|uniref:DUF6594 domain-containing protein n=1 Tax=Alternaria panax TaxID=48097 RepID=A0AAD4I4B1_9PLEO|nr:hypothetical protein G6011_02158 [Alternaria panax]
MAPLPSKANMNLYRIYNGGDGRAANGEMAVLYGEKDQSIPSNLATAESDDLEPMAESIRDFFMDLAMKYVLRPSKVLLHALPLYRMESMAAGTDVEFVHEKTVSAVANASVYLLAILVLIAPIATFTVVQDQTSRIVIMPLFCLLLTGSAQLMGPRSMPLFILVTAYFQAMVVFVTITNGR